MPFWVAKLEMGSLSTQSTFSSQDRERAQFQRPRRLKHSRELYRRNPVLRLRRASGPPGVCFPGKRRNSSIRASPVNRFRPSSLPRRLEKAWPRSPEPDRSHKRSPDSGCTQCGPETTGIAATQLRQKHRGNPPSPRNRETRRDAPAQCRALGPPRAGRPGGRVRFSRKSRVVCV